MSPTDGGSAKIGRNAPCPCGSGRKYKRCCLAKDRGAAGFTQAERVSALGKLEDFVAEELGPEDDAAYDSFYARWDDRIDGLSPKWIELSEAAYDMWFYLDYRTPEGQGALDLFLKRSPPLTPGERRYLELARETAVRLYEVEDVSPGASVTLRDVAAHTSVTVHERLGSRSLSRADLVAARIIGCGASGRPEIERGLLLIPGLIRESVISQLSSHRESFRREHPGSPEIEVDKEMAPFLHEAWMSCLLDPPIPRLANTDGEEMLLTRVRFEVEDPAGLEAALDQRDELEREQQGKTVWHWSGTNARGEPIILGRIALDGRSLELECNSASRGERGRAMLEHLGGAGVRHRVTAHENLRMALSERLREGASGEGEKGRETAEGLSREEREALTLDHLGRHYHRWLDEPVPALGDRTPREAAGDATLRPKLIDLIRQLEGSYHRALKSGEPAYDPSWMWDELGLAARSSHAHPPPLAPERMATLEPGIGELCRTLAAQVRQRPGFDDASTVVTAGEIGASVEVRRFLREHPHREEAEVHAGAGEAAGGLAALIQCLVNFELHRRKTFWVDESLAYMLAQTDLDVPGGQLRVPFPSFALVFTDRYVLSLAERMLSADRRCPVAGQFLRVATVFVTEEPLAEQRMLRLGLALDALGADPPHLVTQEVALADTAPVRQALEALAPRVVSEPPVPDAHPLRGLLHVALNAILYAASAGVEAELRPSPADARGGTLPFSSESVYFLPGHIEISRVRSMQQLERVPSGRQLLHRFMVRGHWRRPAADWKDQRVRWIEPYWKGPDLAAVIERTYKLNP